MFWVKTTFMTECKFIYLKILHCWGLQLVGQYDEGEAEAECGEGVGGGGGVAEAVAAEALLGVAVVSALGHPRGGRVRGAGERQLGAVPQPGNAEGR